MTYIISPEAAAIDSHDAINQASSVGFPSGSVIFLDVEKGDRISPSWIDYITNWIMTIHNTQGSKYEINPGVYCSHFQTADQIQQAIQAIDPTVQVKFWVFKILAIGTCPL